MNPEISLGLGRTSYIPQKRAAIRDWSIRPEGPKLINTIADLSPRQLQLIQLLCRGLRNKQIASEMGLTLGSVKVYIFRLYPALGVTSRTEAMLWAYRQGLGENIATESKRLSRRERQIALLLLRSKLNKEIAWELGLAFATVQAYMHRLIKKLGVRSRIGVALWAIKNLMCDDPEQCRGREESKERDREDESDTHCFTSPTLLRPTIPG